ncbi:type II toxin-antitoxin system RelE/ParE family toxin [Phragmitibacter flavus]|nr:type II toxin-antitoxin system RelE/ParE family toxin [Phragmitibacter flavus]
MNWRLDVRIEASLDFDRAIEWYADHGSSELAHRFIADVKLAFDEIQNSPERFHFSRWGTRRFKLKKFPYDIHYLVEKDRVVVMAVFHQRRDDRQLGERL